VHGVKMSPQTAQATARIAADKGIQLSAHAPYYINLNSREPEKVAASHERIVQTARVMSILGGKSIVFHAAFYMTDAPDTVYIKVRDNMERILAQLAGEGNGVCLRPEVMGKVSQFGTINEVLELCSELKGVAPAIDFSHWHARTGKANSYDEFTAVLKQIEGKLGRKALDDMHIHVSGIDYGLKGEVRHRNLTDSDFNYTELMKALKDFEVSGLLICESPNQEEDALLLKRTYLSI